MRERERGKERRIKLEREGKGRRDERREGKKSR